MTSSNVQSVSMMGFHNLPEEMILEVFSYLDPATLICQVSRVCRQWHNLHKNPGLYRHLRIMGDSPKTTGGAVEMIQMAPLLTSLHMSGRKDTNTILHCLVEHLAENRGHLKALDLDHSDGGSDEDISSTTLLNVFKQCPELQHLVLDRNDFADGMFLKEIGQLLPKLKSFEFNGDAFGHITAALLSIAKRPNAFPFTSLTLDCYPLGDTFTDTFDVFCERFQHTLQVVNLEHSEMTDVNLKSLSRCHNVTDLMFQGRDISDDGLMLALSAMPNINLLVVRFAHKVTKDGWIRFFRVPHVKNIRQLLLSGCANLDIDVTRAIQQNVISTMGLRFGCGAVKCG